MNEFNKEQALILNMLREMKECYEALPFHNSMKATIADSFHQLRETFAAKTAKDLINDKLMFKGKQ